MKFKLVKTLAKNFSVCNAEEQFDKVEAPILSLNSLTVKVRVPSDKQAQTFAIHFKVDATLIVSECLSVKCDYWAFFESEQVLTQDFLDSHFTSINAPAIAYPYLRSFITNILVNAGYPALYLPTVNFVEMAKRQQVPG